MVAGRDMPSRGGGRGAANPRGASKHGAQPGESEQDSQSQFVDVISASDKWYEGEAETRESLSRMVMELVSACPSKVHTICENLVKVLARGAEDEAGAYLHIGGRTFHNRSNLKAECQQLLRQCADNAHLDESDARFVLELLSHHPRGAEKSKACSAVSAGPHPTFPTRCFFVVREDGREDFSYIRCLDNTPTSEIRVQQHICHVLCAILQLHPSACEKTARSIEERFPPFVGHMGSVERHRNWARSILFLCSQVPQLSEYLLSVLIRRMVEIDATIHKLEEGVPDLGAVLGDQAKDDALFDHMAHILDANMMLMFEFLQRRLTAAVSDAENQLAKSLFSVFEGTVLLTHKVRCVQFLWLYLASLRPAWAEAFLSVVLQIAYSPAHGMAKRVISFAYLASFVARAQYLTTKYALRTAQYISTFARETLPIAEAHIARGEASHPQVVLFLSAVQALCYILCFCMSRFAEEPKGLSSLLPAGSEDVGAEAFTPVLESTFRPLTRISPPVAKECCRVLRQHRPQLSMALREQLRTSGRAHDAEAEEADEGSFHGEAAGLDAFFPFDPYRLRHSSMFLLGLYREWVSPADDSESDTEAPGGFQADATAAGARGAPSPSATDDEGNSDADFTDAADVAERGFIPSIGPSPAFRPRTSLDMLDVSPLIVPMDTMDDDENFSLPQASVDVGSNMLHSFLGSSAYKAGVTAGPMPVASAV
mmetsp:Transcript_76185/g.202283  ORF Transcript_76185/g.202283 Transcript_76185/m.202283 type:complete len:712 (-) Transcript_76185:66-2201(-)